ncbi:MAG: ClpXP protease specificity-enhancing factor SspB [Alphaproteobacteria bacterium]|nr:ClpXP protease specificity-enhancing factor SspB [Alphaproteobacteria bacterium]
MTGDGMDFEAMAADALRALMATALGEVARRGLLGDHHFYITYNTGHDGVRMPGALRAQYPEAITIVLQHEFWDLKVTDEEFSVSLAFNGVPHHLVVPFDAVVGFADPSVNFSIQYNLLRADGEPAPQDDPVVDRDSPNDKPGEVVTLDAFRKK